MKRIAFYAVLALMLAGAITYFAQSTEPEATPYRLSPDGKLNQTRAPQFIHLQVETRGLHEFGIILYWGVATWTKEAGDQGRLATVPITLVLPQPDQDELQEIATYFTNEDGRFWLVAPIGKPYLLMARSEQAANPPDKARKYFEMRKKMLEGKERVM